MALKNTSFVWFLWMSWNTYFLTADVYDNYALLTFKKKNY